MTATQPTIVVTSIQEPTGAIRVMAEGARKAGWSLIVVGDRGSPERFDVADCEFISLADQRRFDLATARACPERHYARKNIGYLLAARGGACAIIDTDDDNIPREDFFSLPERRQTVPVVSASGWVNVYRYFTDARIWPRGLPLDAVNVQPPPFEALPVREVDCPIQQRLADDDPDVDAIYRLLMPLPQAFRRDRRVGLAPGTWCPFNSQNTIWLPAAYPLLYLPSSCTMRISDIWRSLIAQRIAWSNGWSVLFAGPTARQERNHHDLIKDFADEVPGYLHNRAIADRLARLDIAPGEDAVPDNMRACYAAIVSMGRLDARELGILDAWLADVAACARHAPHRPAPRHDRALAESGSLAPSGS